MKSNSTAAVQLNFPVISILNNLKFSFSSEKDLHQSLEAVFKSKGLEFDRELCLSPKDRIDFLFKSGLGIEVKTKGSSTALLRQVRRYSESDQIQELLVIVSLSKLNLGFLKLNDKPISFYLVRSF
jgi:hypothetical protein